MNLPPLASLGRMRWCEGVMVQRLLLKPSFHLLMLCVSPALSSCQGNADPPPTSILLADDCFVDGDCEQGKLCFDVGCLRPPPCRSGNDADCVTECVGECANPSAIDYCRTDSDCGEDEPICRRDPRFCLEDRRTSEPDCIGWCTGPCFQGVISILDPSNGLCYIYPDSCKPPGFPLATNSQNCIGF